MAIHLRSTLAIPGYAFALAATLSLFPARASDALDQSRSAFERSFADSPIDWQPWSEQTLASAQAEGKPIYLFIGDFTDQLARAMRNASFAHAGISENLNTAFVCAIADKRLYPELAAFLGTYVHEIKQSQGWPLSVWLTPEGKPFEGSSYLPPADEWGNEGFPNVLKRVSAAWQSDPAAQRALAQENIEYIQGTLTEGAGTVSAEALDGMISDEIAGWLGLFDPANGGFGEAPKALQPELSRAFLQAGQEAKDAALKTLDAIIGSPVRDPLDGGFFNGTNDGSWLEPVFQKRLADQARMAIALLDAARSGSDNSHYTAAARDALRFALDLKAPEGGFIEAIDGSEESNAPSFFWTEREAAAAIGKDNAKAASELLGISEKGNLGDMAFLGMETKGKNLPRCLPLPTDDTNRELLDKATAALRAIRETRFDWSRGSVASSGDHGILLEALSRAGTELGDDALAKAASELADFIVNRFVDESGSHVTVSPNRNGPASPNDHALVISGLMHFAKASGDLSKAATAHALLENLRKDYWIREYARFVATKAPFPPGVWARVPARGSDRAFSPESLLIANRGILEPALADWTLEAAASILGDMEFAATPSRGDQLLALQAARAALASESR